MRIDGVLDEPIWQTAQPAAGFRQRDPDNGAAATERTEVRVVFEPGRLIIGATLLRQRARSPARQPDAARSVVLRRRPVHRHARHVRRRPQRLRLPDQPGRRAGGRADRAEHQHQRRRRSSISAPTSTRRGTASGSAGSGGRPTAGRRRWRSRCGPSTSIPVSTRGASTSSGRSGARPRRACGAATCATRASRTCRAPAGSRGCSGCRRGWASISSRTSSVTCRRRPGAACRPGAPTGDVGLDVFYNLTPALRANLSINTDFAETEVDQRQVNLTRFPLFFEEKRDFFLQGASYFDFAREIGRQVTPFFSRRIGLDADGDPAADRRRRQDHRAGGAFDVGVLQVRTRATGDADRFGLHGGAGAAAGRPGVVRRRAVHAARGSDRRRRRSPDRRARFRAADVDAGAATRRSSGAAGTSTPPTRSTRGEQHRARGARRLPERSVLLRFVVSRAAGPTTTRRSGSSSASASAATTRKWATRGGSGTTGGCARFSRKSTGSSFTTCRTAC